MSHLLDTNVISELRKSPRSADARVVAWARRQSVNNLYISVVTVLEIELGVARLARRDPQQALGLQRWMEAGVLGAFAGRILDVSVEVALQAAHLHIPDPRPERDALIAATAIVHHLTVVTRNLSDFEPTGVATLDPWVTS